MPVSLRPLKLTSTSEPAQFWIERDGDDLYLHWGDVLIGRLSVAEWSFAIANPKQPKNKVA